MDRDRAGVDLRMPVVGAHEVGDQVDRGPTEFGSVGCRRGIDAGPTASSHAVSDATIGHQPDGGAPDRQRRTSAQHRRSGEPFTVEVAPVGRAEVGDLDVALPSA